MPVLYVPTPEQEAARNAAKAADAKAELDAIESAINASKGMRRFERGRYMKSFADALTKQQFDSEYKKTVARQDAEADALQDKAKADADREEWDRRNEIQYRQNLQIAGIKDEQAAKRAQLELSQGDREKFDAARDLMDFGREIRAKANALKSRIGPARGVLQVLAGELGFQNDISVLDQDLKTYQRKIARANEKGLLTDSDIAGYASAAPSVRLEPKYFFQKLDAGVARIERSVQRSLVTSRARGANVKGYEDLLPSAQEVSADDLE